MAIVQGEVLAKSLTPNFTGRDVSLLQCWRLGRIIRWEIPPGPRSRGGVMSQPTACQLIDRQVTRARRRLIGQLLVRHLAVAWAVGAAADRRLDARRAVRRRDTAGVAAVGRPRRLRRAFSTLLWPCPTLRRAPSRTDAALALDDSFGLRERVVTA